MNRRCHQAWLILALAAGSVRAAAALPTGWQYQQQFKVDAPGLVRLSLPPETLGAARPLLEDLRVYDDNGHELPFLIQRSVALRKSVQTPKSFQVSLARSNTVILIETGLTEPVSAITLESPARGFIKSVSLEGSQDGSRWQRLAQGQPIFRQDDSAASMDLIGPGGSWSWLRLTLDDERSPPVPITGARLRTRTAETPPSEPLPISIIRSQETPGETRVTLDLGAANQHLAEIQIEASDPLFTRPVKIAVQQITGALVQEHVLGQGAIYRMALEGYPVVSNLTLPFDTLVPTRQLFLLILNQDSPPLHITGVSAQRRPIDLVFLAGSAGLHHLMTGNTQCPPAVYDLAALSANLQATRPSLIRVSPIEANPLYRAPEVLPEVQEASTALDTSGWRFRKTINVLQPGPQQVELDLDVLAHARPGFEDLRLVRSGSQIPYILERTTGSHALIPPVTSLPAEEPQMTRWAIKLPRPGLPVTTLRCDSPTALFRRDLVLYESLHNEIGEPFRHTLGHASWTRVPGGALTPLRLALESPPQSDMVVLETSNGDNPAIQLERFQLDYPITRLLFKADAPGGLFLLYGRPDVAAPRYDLSLVAGQLLAAERAEATPGVEEPLGAKADRAGKAWRGGLLFWGVLALVVCALLAVISRLLPKTSQV